LTDNNLAARRGLTSTVYSPAEDSRLLARAAVDRLEPGDTVLDVGTGSGYVGARAAAETDATVYGCDINPHACQRAHDKGLQTARTDLLHGFQKKIFDWVLFNPPYLPTPEELEANDWMERALSGGEDGRRVINPFLDDVGEVLAPGGRVLLLLSSLTGLVEVTGRAAESGFITTEVASESFPFERLVVLEIARPKDQRPRQ
jgi:release factor glutamine methyltransferase